MGICSSDPKKVQVRRSTQLLEACGTGDHHEVSNTLNELDKDKNYADINFIDEDGKTGLMIACEIGSAIIAAMLIKKGADISFKDRFGRTALDYAKKRGRADLVSMLTAAAANLKEKSDSDQGSGKILLLADKKQLKARKAEMTLLGLRGKLSRRPASNKTELSGASNDNPSTT